MKALILGYILPLLLVFGIGYLIDYHNDWYMILLIPYFIFLYIGWYKDDGFAYKWYKEK